MRRACESTGVYLFWAISSKSHRYSVHGIDLRHKIHEFFLSLSVPSRHAFTLSAAVASTHSTHRTVASFVYCCPFSLMVVG